MRRIAFVIAAMLLLSGQADFGPNSKVAPLVLYGTDGTIAVGFEFEVKDVRAVEDNRKLAVALLPAAKIFAEAKKARLINIRAKQVTGTVGQKQTFESYGYTWEKDAASDAWIEKKSNSPPPAPSPR